MNWIIIISIGVFTGWLAGVAIGGGGGFFDEYSYRRFGLGDRIFFRGLAHQWHRYSS